VANMAPLWREHHPELEELFRLYDDTMSFVPNSLFTMARRPEILRAFSELITRIWRTGTVPVGLKPLVAIVASTAGCGYRQAHETVDATMRGVDEAKIAEIWDFERSPRYSEAERVALRFARDASVVPNAVTPEHFEELREHWDDGEIVEILLVVGLFGFLNRWNDSMATDLEEVPTAFAGRTIGPHGWEPGKHG
jgi:alkylhydroperoxidase family enzyme